MNNFRYFMALLLLIMSVPVAAELNEGIIAKVEPVKTQYAAQDALEVKVTYTNVSDLDVRFLKWHTALEGMVGGDFLSITYDGEELPYVGAHVKRLPPQESDYVTLAPGQSLSAVVNLSKAYNIEAEGDYRVFHRGMLTQLSKSSDATESSVSDLLNFGGMVLKVTQARPPVRTSLNTLKEAKRTPVIQNCNASQINLINQALGIAERLSITAINDLNNAPVGQRPSARRYLEWFGAYDANRYETVRQGMARITSALVNQTIGFDCACNDSRRENLFAFVFTNDPYNMNVCPVFFRTTAAGTDSRAGTIIHEISHFNVVARTDDFSSALNQSGSRSLARSNPNNAIRNANAFEYFAENTPFLPMPVASVTSPPAPNPTPSPETEPQKPNIRPIIPLLLDDEA